MKRFTHKLLTALTGMGLALGTLSSLQACDSYGGGYGRRSSSYSRRPVVIVQPVVRQVAPPTYPVQTQVILPQQQMPTGITNGANPQGANPQGLSTMTAQPAPGNPQMTALQMLSEFGGTPANPPADAGAPTAPAGFRGAGIWKATLPNNAVVQLNLQENGMFTWTALANGKRSTFEGRYTLEGESLTLVRQNDNQRLEGSLTLAGNDSFLFKLNNTQDAGLRFTRS